jgi:hypothetical protein
VVLHYRFERGIDGEKARLPLKRFLEKGFELEWLGPPDFSGALNVGYVVKAVDAQDHVRRVREWTEFVYARWHQAHAANIMLMAQRVFDRGVRKVDGR